MALLGDVAAARTAVRCSVDALDRDVAAAFREVSRRITGLADAVAALQDTHAAAAARTLPLPTAVSSASAAAAVAALLASAAASGARSESAVSGELSASFASKSGAALRGSLCKSGNPAPPEWQWAATGSAQPQISARAYGTSVSQYGPPAS